MKVRCEIHLSGHRYRLILVPRPEEKPDHLSMKLAAFVMFHKVEPLVEPSSRHPTLLGTDFRPDVMGLNKDGEIGLWIECGAVTLHKLDKVTRRFPRARVIVIKSSRREAGRFRIDIAEGIRHGRKIEIWTWPDGEFERWLNAMEEKTEIFGEADEKVFNLVINEFPYMTDLISV